MQPAHEQKDSAALVLCSVAGVTFLRFLHHRLLLPQPERREIRKSHGKKPFKLLLSPCQTGGFSRHVTGLKLQTKDWSIFGHSCLSFKWFYIRYSKFHCLSKFSLNFSCLLSIDPSKWINWGAWSHFQVPSQSWSHKSLACIALGQRKHPQFPSVHPALVGLSWGTRKQRKV